MGSSTYSDAAYTSRVTTRAATGAPVFAHTDDIRRGKTAAKAHDKMDPKGAVRESRDSDEHPVSVPIAVIMDTTGSMGRVPGILEANLPKLMGAFLNDKASGKAYLGDGYPAILIGAVDDYRAMGGGSGTLQVGQFESGIEIDEDLERIWLTGRGGGSYEESYELALYFMAHKTVHDHFEKRGRKGYLFIIGDEHAYDTARADEITEIIGDTVQGGISFEEVLAEAQERYNVFFVIPNMTQHYHDDNLIKWWVERLGQQNVLRLEEPEKVCELIASCVAISEEHVGIDDLVADGLDAGGVKDALVPLSKLSGGGLATHAPDALTPLDGDSSGEVERL